ncbi:MAG TPA: hypothetical protein VGJ14_19315 [Sporichthyaceae bacterium]|jgi:hypothetical protein
MRLPEWLHRRTRRQDRNLDDHPTVATHPAEALPAKGSPAPEPGPATRGLSWPEVALGEGRAGELVELPDSRPEAGGPPVRVDPGMVSPAAAERMRPLPSIPD